MILIIENQEDRKNILEIEYNTPEKLKSVFAELIERNIKSCYLITDSESIAVTQCPLLAAKTIMAFSGYYESDNTIVLKIFDSSDTDVAMQVAGDIMNVDLTTEKQLLGKMIDKQINNIN